VKRIKKFSKFRKKGKVSLKKPGEAGVMIFDPISKKNSPAPAHSIGISMKRYSDI